MDFKLKYSGSALGYVWSVLKPLSLFTAASSLPGRCSAYGFGVKEIVLPRPSQIIHT